MFSLKILRPFFLSLWALSLIVACGEEGIPLTLQTNNATTTIPFSNGDASYIKIASFNIAELGNPGRAKDFKEIARILNGLDLISIQEVRDTGGAEAIAAIHKELNALAERPYAPPVVIPNAGYGFGYPYPVKEGYAFLYRDPVKIVPLNTMPEWNTLADDVLQTFRYNNHDIYGRIPALAYFKAGTFDFIVAALHLQWSNVIKRKAEMQDVKDWLIEFSKRDATRERDLIIVGDINRYGSLPNSVIEQHLAPFDVMIDTNHLGKSYRLITLEFLPTPDTRFAPLDTQSTTVGKENNLYDQIFISAGAFYEHEASPSQFDQDMGVLPFDLSDRWQNKSAEAIKDAVSDHRPIWARFRINLPDDD